MARWRRLCIDVDDDLEVLGASIEWYSDRKTGPDEIGVLARSDWNRHTVEEVLEELCAAGWNQLSFQFGPPSHLG